MSSLGYRSDIDGLRAVAVLSVILFHAGVPFMTGGYVGVDVFFVISGFLITSLILKDLKAQSFSFSGFWERRVRRILPALSVVVLTTVAAGWFLLLPDDYAALGKQVAAQAVFGSNILFYKEAGYFDVDSFLKPLLHTWSLSVEEQYYILFPLAAVYVWKKYPHRFFLFLVSTAVVSFLLCLLIMRNNPELAFFMLPFRGWELLIGAILAYSLQEQTKVAPRALREAVSLSGLLAIVIPVLLYSEKTAFPGVAALAPCLGAGCFIWANAGGQTMAGRFLSLRPVVFIGLVSYSWYLWHWPVIVFVKYVPFLEFNVWLATACVVGSFVLSILTWHFVEKPFRRFSWLPERKKILICSFSMLAVFVVAGGSLFLSAGLPVRLNDAVVKYASGIEDTNPYRGQCDKTGPIKINADKVCMTNSGVHAPEFILWGDSQGDAMASVFFELSKKYGRNGYVATHHGCPAILDYRLKDWTDDCANQNKAVFDFITRNRIKHVFLVSSWQSWMQYEKSEPDGIAWDEPKGSRHEMKTAAALQRTIDGLKKNGAIVYFVPEVPSAIFDPPRILAQQAFYNHTLKSPLLKKEEYLKLRTDFDKNFLNKAEGITVIEPIDKMCPHDVCLVEEGGYSLYYNKGHISTHGASYLAPLFEEYFKRGFSKP